MAIACGHCTKRHESVEEVRLCSIRSVGISSQQFLGNPKIQLERPTEKQLDYAHKLLRWKVIPVHLPVIGDVLAEQGAGAAHTALNSLNREEIGAFISAMKGQPDLPRGSAQKTERVQVDEGVYQMNDLIYKVKRAVHGSGHLYAQQLTPAGFRMEPGAISKLRPEHKMTVEEAGKYGAIYGMCIVCGRTLTDEVSIKAGIGPVCSGRRQMFQAAVSQRLTSA